ncbi:hypothetical protein [Acinetobacter sp. WZC-1]|uniref:hypothetical protein n=1 Tax=Acinetobacter sp. WZC-1 TaxID=3459034 RepID=UPI00403DDD46
MSKTIEDDVFQNSLKESVHFSFKTINSNIEKGGIRLSKKQALDLPYISARTLLNEDFLIPTDYQANAGKTASIFKVVKAAMLDDDISSEEVEFQHQVEQLKSSIHTVFDEPYQAGTEYIDIRMRQVLIPKKDGEYLSISPLTAAGVNYLINQEVDFINEVRKEKDSEFNRIQTAVFGIGGANPQNVGSLVRAMQRPVTLGSPQANEKTRQAFAVFYNGFKFNILCKIKISKGEKQALQALEKWAGILNRQLIITVNNVIQNWHDLEIFAPTTNKKIREQEILFLEIIVHDVLHQASIQKNILEEAESILPAMDEIERPSFWVHPSLSLVVQGLIDPELRDDHWRIKFADHLARKITNTTFSVEMESQTVEITLDHHAEGYITRRLREMIR